MISNGWRMDNKNWHGREKRSRRTLRLLANRLVDLEVVESISHETVRQALKKTL